MKLVRPFVRLPIRFDVARLQAEVAALPESAWAVHPTGFPGNSAVRLISLEGGENDAMAGGQMAATSHLAQSPYIQQVLGAFGSVWSRSRLMKLAPGAVVPEHADINYHWLTRVRVHIPVQTQPSVHFHCGGETVHMGAGEAWIFDNWRSHRVENFTDRERIHLVADTTGSAAFWRLVEQGVAGATDLFVPYVAGRQVSLACERYNVHDVIPPSEIEAMFRDLIGESVVIDGSGATASQIVEFESLLEAFCRDWRQLWCLYADTPAGRPRFEQLIAAFRRVTTPVANGLASKTNGTPMMRVTNARLQFAINDAEGAAGASGDGEALSTMSVSAGAAVEAVAPAKLFSLKPRVPLSRPLIIVAAPRSGSTALFETLAVTPQVSSLGGEAHWLVEGFEHLRPGSGLVDSNRVLDIHATAEVIDAIRDAVAARLVDVQGQPAGQSSSRWIEKTPKNALRIPFLNQVFPDAQYLFLWRDPYENISSIIQAWKSERYVTYRNLEGWDGPWSLLLPPGWQNCKGRSLAEVATFQWCVTNALIMDDLEQCVPRERRSVVRYADWQSNPVATIAQICSFAGIEFDEALRERAAGPLKASRHTLTPPAPGKWRENAAAIEPLAKLFTPIWTRLQGYT